MSVTFDTLSVAKFRSEFPSKTAFQKQACSICLLKFIFVKDDLKILVHGGKAWARHPHHVECLPPWLEKNNCCPCCRKEVSLPYSKEAWKIFKKITVNGLGSGLLVGAVGLINNAVFSHFEHPRTPIGGNNILFAISLAAGSCQVLINDPEEQKEMRVWTLALLPLTAMILLHVHSGEVAAYIGIAALITSVITIGLLKAGGTTKGLISPMLVAIAISACTSSMKIPLPAVPLAYLSIVLGSVDTLKNGP